MGYLQVNTRAFDKEYVNKDQQKGVSYVKTLAKSLEICLQMIKSKKARLK